MSAQIEATLDALVSKLNTDLPAKITSLNAEFSDGHTLDLPALICAGVRDTHDYPLVFVLPEETETETDRAGGMIWRHRIRVCSFIAAWEEEAVTRLAIRYQRAVREVCLTNRNPGTGGGFGLRHVLDEYGPVFSPTDSGQAQASFVQGSATILEVRQLQDLS